MLVRNVHVQDAQFNCLKKRLAKVKAVIAKKENQIKWGKNAKSALSDGAYEKLLFLVGIDQFSNY